MTDFRFVPEPPSIHAHGALDLLGNAFAADYVGGMAEWLKNAVDAYIREGVDDEDQHIVLRLGLLGPRLSWTFECIDFVGSLFVEVDEDFKRWCDPEAASKGGQHQDVYGGHGNGGKFHMRENFKRAELITYRNGGLTVFRFQNKDYGFEPNHRGQPCRPKKALEIAGIEPSELPRAIQERFAAGDVRFTLVREIGPIFMQRRMRGGWHAFVDRLQRHGQSKQLLDRAPIEVVVNGKVVIEDLDAPEIEPKPGFVEPRVVEMPGSLPFEGEKLSYMPDGAPAGRLVLRTSKQPFPRRGDDAVLNSIDIRGRRSVIATYRMHELGITNYQGASFIYGTLESPRLEEMGLKTNERRRLPDNDYSAAVLHWVAEQVDEYAIELVEDVGKEQEEKEAAAMSLQNKLLNAWKNQLLRRFFVEVPAGADEGAGIGGTGPGDEGGANGDGGDGGDGGTGGEGAGDKGGAGDERKRSQRFPLVLISGVDPDPDTGATIVLDPAQDVVYQRYVDVQRNVWWINAQRPLAQRIRQEYGPDSPRWRDYLFQRYVDIIVTYALHERWRDEPDPNPDLVGQWVSETVGRIHDSAARELEAFLFAKEARVNGGAAAGAAEAPDEVGAEE
jgi:hypothetical protein